VTGILIGVGAAITLVMLHAVLIAPRRLRKTVVDVPLPGLGLPFDGYTLAVIADVHHWGLGTRYLQRIVRMSNEVDPDLVVLLGDYGISFEHNQKLSAMAYRGALPSLADAFRELHARDGCVAVLGNHDHYYDGDRVAEWLRTLNIRVLINDHVTFRRGEASLVIGGVGDAIEDSVDPRGGAGDQPAGSAIIVLCHNPDGVDRFDPRSGIGLVLSGHTHGGQIVIPGYGALTTHTRICSRRAPSGWIPNDRVRLYVTRGVGVQVPIRFRCSPEVLIVRLRAVADQQPV
jgi:predicted MPP superfamily phosphohydrolase